MTFLDTNVFMYAAGADGPYRDPCRRILVASVRSGLQAATNTEVVQEILYRYRRTAEASMAVHRARQACAVVAAVLPVEDDDLRRAMEILERHEAVGVRGAIHAASALRWRCERIVSTDRGFDLLAAEGVVRADPVAFAADLPDA